MKKVYLLLIIITFFSCSKKEESTSSDENGVSNTIAKGSVYGTNFTQNGGFVTTFSANNIQKLTIRHSNDPINCNNDLYEFPITISVPKLIGKFTTNVNITFRNTTNGEFVSTVSNLQVEIISIGTTVKGKVKGEAITENCSINGAFEVSICI